MAFTYDLKTGFRVTYDERQWILQKKYFNNVKQEEWYKDIAFYPKFDQLAIALFEKCYMSDEELLDMYSLHTALYRIKEEIQKLAAAHIEYVKQIKQEQPHLRND